MDGKTPELPEDQERSDEAGYVYVHRDLPVDHTVEISGAINVDVAAGGRVLGVELIGVMQWFDMFIEVLRVLPQKIYDAAYQAGREGAARLADETAEAILVAHQRFDIGGCLCGWSELGKSHPRHQVAMLRQAAYEVLDQEINLGRSRRGVGDNTEEQQQGNG